MSANVPPSRSLRERPDLDQLKRQAKELLDAFRAGEPNAVAEVAAWYRGVNAETFALHHAQLVIARAYGFTSWPKLKAHVDGVTLHHAADAVRAGDVTEVAAMLERRPELVHIDMAEHNEHRLLHYAVLERNPEMVGLLMRHGADARKGIYPHRDATSALTIATDRGYDEIVAVIQEGEAARRASRAESPENSTPTADAVCEAIGNEQRAAAIAMFEADPSLVNAHHRDGWTPLHAAAAMLDRTLVMWLLDRGANVNARGAEGRTPLDVAAELLHTPDFSGPRWTAKLIDYVVRRRFRAIAADLLRCGAELSPASAVALGHANWLRARHAERPLGDAIRYSVVEPSTGLLTLAAKHDRSDILKLLLDLGLDPNERTRLEDVEDAVYSAGMPLYHCATAGKLEMAKVLLDAGADPNVQVYASGSAMHRAYSSGNAAMIELLMRHGGVPDAITVSSLKQVDIARRMLDDEAAGRLPKAAVVGMMGGDAVAEDLLWGGSGAGSVEIVRMALERIDWPRTDGRWYSMLREPMYIGMKRSKAEREALLECFRLILERYDVGSRGQRERGWMGGRTLLHELPSARHAMPPEDQVTIATMLLDAGAPLDVRDDLLKSTPLGWACRWGRAELVRFLMSRGADPIEADAAPWAGPRAWAASRGHEAVLRVLDGR